MGIYAIGGSIGGRVPARRHQIPLVCVLSNGHLLLEDIPGVGKTTLVHILGKILGFNVSRIQFTNDLLPSDVTGLSIFNKEKNRITNLGDNELTKDQIEAFKAKYNDVFLSMVETPVSFMFDSSPLSSTPIVRLSLEASTLLTSSTSISSLLCDDFLSSVYVSVLWVEFKAMLGLSKGWWFY